MPDTAAIVARYKQQRGFTFPVAIGTEVVERAFAVPYFPFKVLVAPEGPWLAVQNEHCAICFATSINAFRAQM
jgi:hypothetical protein